MIGWNGEWTFMIHISWHGSTPPWLWSGIYEESYSWEDVRRLCHSSISMLSRGKPNWYWWYKRDTKLVNCHKVTFCEWVIPHKCIHGWCHKKGFLIVPCSHNASQQVITHSTGNLHHKNTCQFITMRCKSFKYFMLIYQFCGWLFYRTSTLAHWHTSNQETKFHDNFYKSRSSIILVIFEHLSELEIPTWLTGVRKWICFLKWNVYPISWNDEKKDTKRYHLSKRIGW